MAISFSFKNNVQVLKFSGGLSQEEFSQVVVKLEEKIAQQRRQFLFHLELFKTQEEASKAKMIQLIRFCFDKKVQLALCLANKNWAAYSVGVHPLAKMFNTETEALAHFHLTENTPVPKAESLDEMKIRDTDLLVKKYEAFHKPDELDPYHLKKILALYTQTPTVEAIEHLEKASLDIERRKQSLQRLELQCTQISQEAFAMSIARTTPLKDSEWLARQKQIDAQKIALMSQQSLYEGQMAELRAELQTIDKRLENLLGLLQAGE